MLHLFYTFCRSELKELGIKSLKELKAVAGKNFSNGDFKELFKSKVLKNKEVNANCSVSSLTILQSRLEHNFDHYIF